MPSPVAAAAVSPSAASHATPNHQQISSTSPAVPGTPGSDAAGLKTRRSHRKSRNGCAECKRRHIRCDERRPHCSNCSIAERACAYPTPTGGARQRKPQHHENNHSPDAVWTPPTSDMTACSTDSMYRGALHQPLSAPPTPQVIESPPLTHTCPPGIFNSQHLMLLHHAVTDMDHGGVGPPGQMQQIVSIAIRRVVDAPYLIDQMLALAALHIASQIPDSIGRPALHPASGMSVHGLQHLATELQTRAVTSFTRLTKGIAPDDTDTCVPRFLFSSVLSLHSLADTLSVLRSDDVDFHIFIDRFVDCIHIHRGVQAVIRPIFQFLIDSELRPLLDITHQATPHSPTGGAECASLRNLLAVSDLPDPSLNACRAAVDQLQWAFDLFNNLPDRNGPHAVSAFSVMVQADYVEVLRRHQPPALVILAHYGVLLHRCRRFWIFRDAGAKMIQIIARHLGMYWHEALAWPLRVIEVEVD